MSVLRQPPRALLMLVLALCLVCSFALYAQEDVNKAIPPSISPADEVVVETNVAPVILPESIPASNQEVEEAAKAVVTKTQSEEVTIPLCVEEKVKFTEPTIIVKEPAKEPVKEASEEPAKEPTKEPVVVAETKPLTPVVTPTPAATTSTTTPNAVAMAEADTTKPAVKPYYFESSRGSVLAVILVLLTFVTYYTIQAQRGKNMFIRRISGLSAIEDAVGRASEMGRGVLYVPGIADMDDIQTIAGVTIMGHVARTTAEFDTDLYAPQCRSFVMSVAQEVVKQAYMEKGRLDAYRPDRINYITDDQFGYVAAAGGIMMRDKPAACFYLGTFYAESLILAETGNSVGAIQIAGTAEPSQIPFFVASCDYTLIGEELFAASAYLSKNPREVGSLKGQDMVKVVIILAILVGTILVTVANTEYGKTSKFATMAATYMDFLQ